MSTKASNATGKKQAASQKKTDPPKEQKQEALKMTNEIKTCCPHCKSGSSKIYKTRNQQIGNRNFTFRYRTCKKCNKNFVSRLEK